MKRRYLYIFSLVLVVVALFVPSSPLLAQQFNDNYGTSNIYGDSYDPNQVDGEEEPVDSLGSNKKNRKKKPLNSYLFNDSVKLQNVISWEANPYTNNIDFVQIDTMLEDFHKDYVFFQNQEVGVIYNGNLGGASISQNYFNRVNYTNFSFLEPYAAYIYTPDNVPYYNTKRPFTQLSFFMSGQTQKAEEQLRVIHAQNVSPSTGFNITFRNNGTRGMYESQEARDKNLSVAFNHTGQRYTFHGGYIYNTVTMLENGGITEDRFVKDTLIDLPLNVPTNMQGARNKYFGHTFYFTQTYGIPLSYVADDEVLNLRKKSALFFGTGFNYTNYKKIYNDNFDRVEEGFYDNWYLDGVNSNDSLREKLVDAKAFVQFQPYDREGILSILGGGVGYQHESFYNFAPSDYITVKNDGNVHKNSLYVYADGGGQFREYLKWDGHFKYYPLGYRSQDMNIDGNLLISLNNNKKPIKIVASASYRMQSPSYWEENYYSNHFRWSNSFDKEFETRFEGAFLVEDYGIELGFKQSLTTNKIYYNAEALPAQYGDVLSVTTAYLQKDFRIKGLHLKHRALLQWSSEQAVAPVPFVSANANYYYEFNVVKDVLRMQIGVDGYFNTSFYSFGYNPATMQYYNQNSTKTGDYVWLDGYVSGKWKRLRFLVKFQHLNYELFGGRDYFQVAHYPLNRRMIKFGASWNFYD